jgi:hypothetical protein
MPRNVTWTRPEGGLFTWLTLPESVDGATLLENATRNIAVVYTENRSSLSLMRNFNIPITRENYLDLAYMGDMPSPLSAKEEAELPPEIRQFFPKFNVSNLLRRIVLLVPFELRSRPEVNGRGMQAMIVPPGLLLAIVIVVLAGW